MRSNYSKLIVEFKTYDVYDESFDEDKFLDEMKERFSEATGRECLEIYVEDD